jgi:hypothetical protein
MFFFDISEFRFLLVNDFYPLFMQTLHFLSLMKGGEERRNGLVLRRVISKEGGDDSQNRLCIHK